MKTIVLHIPDEVYINIKQKAITEERSVTRHVLYLIKKEFLVEESKKDTPSEPKEEIVEDDDEYPTMFKKPQ